MLAASRARAGDVVHSHHEQGAVIACSQSDERGTPTTAPLPAFAVDDDYVVVADASLYYVDDLCRAIGMSRQRHHGIAQLVLDAYRAFGDRCVEHLEGDFAFIVWHRRSGRAFCARDFAGRRPLYVAEIDGTVVVASSIPSILEHPAMSAEPNLAVVGAEAASLIFSIDDETAFRGVRA